MKIKIESDGTTAGTRVIGPDGVVLGSVNWVQIFLSKDEIQNEIIMSFNDIELDIITEVKDE